MYHDAPPKRPAQRPAPWVLKTVSSILERRRMDTCDLPGCSNPCYPPHNYCCREHACIADMLSGGMAENEEPDYEALQALQEEHGDVECGLSPDELGALPVQIVKLDAPAEKVSKKRKKGSKSAGTSRRKGSAVRSSGQVTAERGDCCGICLLEWAEDDEAIVLPCSPVAHFFHPECALPWFAKKTLCPSCKGDVRSALEGDG